MQDQILEIAQRIRTLREIMEFTPAEMARAASVTEAEYQEYEAGNKDFSFTFLYNCAQKFGVDIIELLTGETLFCGGAGPADPSVPASGAGV